MKLLLVTGEAISVKELRAALAGEEQAEATEVMVVAPAYAEGALRFWVSDADEAIAKAQQVQAQTVERLRGDGLSASGDTGEADPLQAIQDALQTFPAERILLFTRGGEEARYREDISPEVVRERFGVPAQQVTVSAS